MRMRNEWTAGAALSVLLLAGPAAAQNVTTPTPAQGATGQGGYRVLAGQVEARITKGAPYAAEAVTEKTQVLADGNRITNTSLTKVFRDSEGRTRQEVYSDASTILSIAISDPVAKVSYTLLPAQKIAVQSNRLQLPRVVAPDGPRPEPVMSGGGTGRFVTKPPSDTPPVLPGGHASGGTGREGAATATRSRSNANVTREDLGAQLIEGVMATGTRTTTTIPAGQIGNAQDIRIVSERWFSEDLQLLVMTKHSDPRSGDTIYRLTNIARGEPDASLFKVPAGYTIESRNVRRPE